MTGDRYEEGRAAGLKEAAEIARNEHVFQNEISARHRVKGNVSLEQMRGQCGRTARVIAEAIESKAREQASEYDRRRARIAASIALYRNRRSERHDD